MSDRYALELRVLISAVDSHRLTNDEPAERDEWLYGIVADIRKRLA